MSTIISSSFMHVIHAGLEFSEVQVLLSCFITPSGYSFVAVSIHPVNSLFTVVFVFKSN